MAPCLGAPSWTLNGAPHSQIVVRLGHIQLAIAEYVPQEYDPTPGQSAPRSGAAWNAVTRRSVKLVPVFVQPFDQGVHAKVEDGSGRHGSGDQHAMPKLQRLEGYALAEFYVKAMEEGRTAGELAKSTGYTIGHVQNLVRTFNALRDDLRAAWMAGSLSTSLAEKLAAIKSHAVQLDFFETGGGRTRSVPFKRLHQLLAAIADREESPEWKRGARDVVEYLLGDRSFVGMPEIKRRGRRRSIRGRYFLEGR